MFHFTWESIVVVIRTSNSKPDKLDSERNFCDRDNRTPSYCNSLNRCLGKGMYSARDNKGYSDVRMGWPRKVPQSSHAKSLLHNADVMWHTATWPFDQRTPMRGERADLSPLLACIVKVHFIEKNGPKFSDNTMWAGFRQLQDILLDDFFDCWHNQHVLSLNDMIIVRAVYMIIFIIYC